MSRFSPALAASAALALLLAFSADAQTTDARAPTPEAARALLADVDRDLLRLGNAASRAVWIQSTYITLDTEAVAAQANEAYVNASTTFAKAAARFEKTDVTPSERRQLDLLRTSLTMAAPPDPKEAEELTRWSRRWKAPTAAASTARRENRRRLPRHRGDHGDSRREPRPEADAGSLGGLAHDRRADREGLRASSSSPTKGRAGARLRRHRRDVARQVRHAAGRLRRGVDRLWKQLQPLYRSLHGYVRGRLREIRRRSCPRRADPRAPARQHLGAGLGEHLRPRRAAQATPRSRSTDR